MQTKLIEFLTKNPNSTKLAITEATGIKGLPLFNALKKLQTDGIIAVAGEGPEAMYVLTGIENEIQAEPPKKQKNKPAKQKTEETAVTSTGRDNSKYKFNGEEYGKGPLVRSVVAKYVEDNPDTTFKQLKEVFPDTLMKRFGVFANEQDAKNLSGKKSRYFLKAEHLIKIKGQKTPIAVCNQWTAALMVNFLSVVKALGYKVK